MKEAQGEDGDYLEAFKRNVKFCSSFKNDETYRKIKETIERVKTEDDMDFEEALDYAVNKRRFLIRRNIAKTLEDENKDNIENENSNMSE